MLTVEMAEKVLVFSRLAVVVLRQECVGARRGSMQVFAGNPTVLWSLLYVSTRGRQQVHICTVVL
jgi:hypothetical protein